ncbi:hypothetical protein KI387_006729, partial [Taxus chinensis]
MGKRVIEKLNGIGPGCNNLQEMSVMKMTSFNNYGTGGERDYRVGICGKKNNSSAYTITGFLSIDWGAEGNLTDSETDITWVADDNFIDLGHKEELTNSDGMGYESYLQSYRVFPKPLNKSCYQLPVKSSTPSVEIIVCCG